MPGWVSAPPRCRIWRANSGSIGSVSRIRAASSSRPVSSSARVSPGTGFVGSSAMSPRSATATTPRMSEIGPSTLSRRRSNAAPWSASPGSAAASATIGGAPGNWNRLSQTESSGGASAVISWKVSRTSPAREGRPQHRGRHTGPVPGKGRTRSRSPARSRRRHRATPRTARRRIRRSPLPARRRRQRCRRRARPSDAHPYLRAEPGQPAAQRVTDHARHRAAPGQPAGRARVLRAAACTAPHFHAQARRPGQPLPAAVPPPRPAAPVRQQDAPLSTSRDAPVPARLGGRRQSPTAARNRRRAATSSASSASTAAATGSARPPGSTPWRPGRSRPRRAAAPGHLTRPRARRGRPRDDPLAIRAGHHAAINHTGRTLARRVGRPGRPRSAWHASHRHSRDPPPGLGLPDRCSHRDTAGHRRLVRHNHLPARLPP